MLSLFLISIAAFAAQPTLCTEVQGDRLDPADKIIHSADINSDGLDDAFIQGECFEGRCESGVAINCGQGRFVTVLEKDYGQEGLRPTSETSPTHTNWKVLRGTQQKHKMEPWVSDTSDSLDDVSDVLSRERHFAELLMQKKYEEMKITSPDDFIGEYVFDGVKYVNYHTDEELRKLFELARVGDYQAARMLYFDVMRAKKPHPRYARYKAELEKVENLRILFASGPAIALEDVPEAYLKDTEARRNYAKTNLENIDSTTLRLWIKQDSKLLSAIAKYSASNLDSLPEEYKTNAAVVEAAIAENRSAIEYTDSQLLKDRKRIMLWCERYKISVRKIDQSLLNDPKVADVCIEARPINYQFFSEAVRGDHARAERVLSRDGYMLAFAPKSIKSNLKIVKRAVANYPAAKKYLSPEMIKALGENSPK